MFWPVAGPLGRLDRRFVRAFGRLATETHVNDPPIPGRVDRAGSGPILNLWSVSLRESKYFGNVAQILKGGRRDAQCGTGREK